MAPLLEVNNLHTYFGTNEGIVKAVNGVSLSLEENSVLGVVGESGSGKTMTALSVLRLVPYPGQVVAGQIMYEGRDLLQMSDDEMRHIRGRQISLIFQDAASALNPVITIGSQVEELMLEHTAMSKREARQVTTNLLANMGIPDAKQMLRRYPFQLSGGMAQRVMMAIGVALKPRLLIADEPTSNLDVTLQAEMLQRLRILRQENGTAIMLITHDLGVIAQMAENVAVIYGGYVVEYADTPTLYRRPMHPYTWGLFQSLPRLDAVNQRLRPLSGAPPQMLDPPDQCPFLHRCAKATVECRTSPRPPLTEAEPGHQLACYNPVEVEENARN
jgi:oligopeptide/dipeptide ABC transporter ATP-binding protein